ncbi:MAG: FAD binding domain-containing protein [Bacillota bacterium]
MIPPGLRYVRPLCLDELFAAMKEYGPKGKVFAGGTDILVQIKSGRADVRALIDLKRIKELQFTWRFEGDGVVISSLMTLTAICQDPQLRAMYPILVEAVGTIGSVQVRNRGTIAGNVCNASPAADSLPALLLYEAAVNVIGEKGRRTIPLEQFLVGPGQTALRECEVVESVFLPSPPKHSGAYCKLSRRRGFDLSTVSAGAMVVNDGTVRLAVGAAAPRAFRPREAEQVIAGKLECAEALEKCLELAQAAAAPISDIRASREYRKAMVKVLLRRAIQKAVSRFGAGGNWSD